MVVWLWQGDMVPMLVQIACQSQTTMTGTEDGDGILSRCKPLQIWLTGISERKYGPWRQIECGRTGQHGCLIKIAAGSGDSNLRVNTAGEAGIWHKGQGFPFNWEKKGGGQGAVNFFFFNSHRLLTVQLK